MDRSNGVRLGCPYLAELLELAEVSLAEPRHLGQRSGVHLLGKVLLSESRVPLQELFHIFLLRAHGSFCFLSSASSSSATELQLSSAGSDFSERIKKNQLINQWRDMCNQPEVRQPKNSNPLQ